jgi:hypothetical protein
MLTIRIYFIISIIFVTERKYKIIFLKKNFLLFLLPIMLCLPPLSSYFCPIYCFYTLFSSIPVIVSFICIFFLCLLIVFFLFLIPYIFLSFIFMFNEHGAKGGIKIGRGNRSTRRKPAAVTHCPPQIPHYPTWNRTLVAAVGSHRLSYETALKLLQTNTHISQEHSASIFRDDSQNPFLT